MSNFRIDRIVNVALSVNAAVLSLLFCVLIFTQYKFPIYPDEIQNRLWLSRLPYDFPIKISGAPACHRSFYLGIPITMYVPSVIDWILHGLYDSLQSFRLGGMLLSYSWVVMLYACLCKVIKKPPQVDRNYYFFQNIALYFASFLFLGVFPFFLIINRGEQLILLSIVVLLILTSLKRDQFYKFGFYKQFGVAVLFYLFSSLLLFAHPKSIFLFPVIVTMGLILYTKMTCAVLRGVTIIILGLILFQLIETVRIYEIAFSCPELPKFEEMIKGYVIDPKNFFRDPMLFIAQVSNSLVDFTLLLDRITFQKNTEINYLPSLELDSVVSFVNALIRLNIVLIGSLALAICIRNFFNAIKFKRLSLGFGFVLFLLLLCVSIGSLLNTQKHWYDAGYLYAIIFITGSFYIAHINFSFQYIFVRILLFYTSLVAIISVAVLSNEYLRPFLEGYEGPGVSLVNYNHNEVSEQLYFLSNQCGINPINSKAVFFDDSTYLYVKKGKWPIPITYSYLLEAEGKSVSNLFKEVDSDGMLLRCTSIPDKYLAYSYKVGAYCCVPKHLFNELTHLE
jgi:hypothetical protein